MCHALRARASCVMAARVRLKMRRGTGVSPLAVLLAVCAVLGPPPVNGMFERRQCDHQHPRAHEIIHGVHIEPAHEVKKRSISQPVRILLSYDESVFRNNCVSPINQLLCALRFYATGCYQTTAADLCGFSTSTAHRIVHRVSCAIASLRPLHVLFPETPSQIRKTQMEFYNKARFPRVIGAIDCTHVKFIKSPGGGNAEVFRNRKGYFSLNVQAICNANLEFTDIVARWPGSTHDSHIFNNCYRKAMYQQRRYGNAVLVGDGGYACTSYMMTPLDQCNTAAEHLYNESQIRTRNSIERLFGVWKRRFPVMALGLRVSVKNSFPIIIATVVLHNIARRAGEDVPPDDHEIILPAPWDILLAEGNIDENYLINLQCRLDRPRQRENPNHRERRALVDNYFEKLDDEKLDLINNTILPEAVHFWERALMVRETKSTIRLNRKCESSQVFVKDHHTHCIDTCRPVTMCGEVRVPEDHLDVCRTCNATGHNCGIAEGSKAGPGIDGADFVFYVSAMQTERCHKGLTVAYAAHCQQEAALDRPIAGHANLCPGSISTKPQELETLLSTVKHEILHALGFSVSLYAFYRDENGEPRTPRRSDTGKPPLNEKLQTHQWSENTIKTVVRPRWKVHGGYVERTMQMIVTPRVRAEVQAHFNCPELEGAELEDQGEDGTALTHWEKRVFENEAMTGTHTQNPVYSRITLALMEDTGWYSANYSMAQELGWGKNLGCNFAMKSCKEWISTKSSPLSGKSIHPFCNKVKQDPLQTECTDDRSSVALCNLVKHSLPLPKKYQNFDSIPHVPPGEEQYYGGSVSLADYCPYIQEFTWRARNIVVRGSHCLYEENNPHPDKNFALEKYGPHSRCFDHTNDMWEERTCKQARQWQHWGSGCYLYKCEAGRLHIIVGNYTYTCYHAGQEIIIRIMQNGWLHKGALICPPCRDICQAEFKARNEWCKPGDEHPPSIYYHKDYLHCASADSFSLSISTLIIAILHFIIR